MTEIQRIAAEIVARFEIANRSRDRALAGGRQVIRLAGNSIRATHRGELDEAAALLSEAEDILSALVADVRDQHAIFGAGYVQDAMKEYAEAAVCLAIVRGDDIPSPADLKIEDAPYLNALAEAASELRRLALHVLRGEDIRSAERYLETMDEIYDMLVTIDFPDAITGGLRRTTDQLRAVLERTRGDLTMTLNQRRLEEKIAAAMRSENS
jgi:translin